MFFTAWSLWTRYALFDGGHFTLCVLCAFPTIWGLINPCTVNKMHCFGRPKIENTYNDYSETRNLTGQCPCSMRQSCRGSLNVLPEVWLYFVFTRLLWASNCWQWKTFEVLKLTVNEDEVKCLSKTWRNYNYLCCEISIMTYVRLFFTPPTSRSWRSFKFALFLGFCQFRWHCRVGSDQNIVKLIF